MKVLLVPDSRSRTGHAEVLRVDVRSSIRANTFFLGLVVVVTFRAGLTSLAGIVPPLGPCAGDAFAVGIEVGSIGGANTSLIDCDKSSWASHAGLRVTVPPGVSGTSHALPLSGIPEVGRSAGNALIISSHEGALGRTDAAQLGGFQDISFRAASLVVGCQV